MNERRSAASARPENGRLHTVDRRASQTAQRGARRLRDHIEAARLVQLEFTDRRRTKKFAHILHHNSEILHTRRRAVGACASLLCAA